MYAVKEIFFTLQGEGAQSGRAAVFCRFAGCNLWTGREEDRDTAICQFCDTDFVGTDGIYGGKYETAEKLAKTAKNRWAATTGKPLIVLTGGEPMLQVDDTLIDALHAEGFEIAVESNGTIAVPRSIDWICISPKAGTDIVQKSGDELKFVYPQKGLYPEDFNQMEFKHFFLQPMDDGDDTRSHVIAATAYCMEDPRWRISLQTHKILGIE